MCTCKWFVAVILMAALAVSSAFASIRFSGDVVLGYVWSYGHIEDETAHVIEATYGEDGYPSDEAGFYAQLDARISDGKGIVTAALDGNAYIGDEMGADVTVDIMKLFGVESDFSLKLTGTYNDRVESLRAYRTRYGFADLDRVRTLDGGNPLSLDFAYGRFFQARVAYVFDAPAGRDLLISALVSPVDGLRMSVGWIYAGSSSAGGQGDGSGGYSAAIDIDISALADLDFDLGVSASIVGLLEDDEIDDDYDRTVAVVVYGGNDVVDVGIEFADIDEQNSKESFDDARALSVLVNVNAVENLPVSVYFSIGDFHRLRYTIVAGATVEYEMGDVSVGLAAEFVSGINKLGIGYGISRVYDNCNYATGFGVVGFSIAPYVSVSF